MGPDMDPHLLPEDAHLDLAESDPLRLEIQTALPDPHDPRRVRRTGQQLLEMLRRRSDPMIFKNTDLKLV